MIENLPDSQYEKESSFEQIEGLENSAEEQRALPEKTEEQKIDEYWQARNSTETILLGRQEDLNKIQEINAGLGMVESNNDQIKDEIESLQRSAVQAQANYPGHPTLLLQERLQHPEIKERFVSTRSEALDSLKDNEEIPDKFAKPQLYKSHYTKQIEGYDETLQKVFLSTEIGKAGEFGKSPENVGRSAGIGHEGTVFTDASLSTSQKAIIESHEKGHGMRDFWGSDAQEIREVLDGEARQKFREQYGKKGSASYGGRPEEIIERMSQLKNYFGFKGDEQFTKEHLEYARKHYVEDTGLDNNMTEFFAGITAETEGTFLTVINKYPI